MNKLQKAFDKLGVVLETIINDYMLTSTEINKIKKQYKIIQELINQQSNPTFKECIKEWEERGWTVSELKQFPVIKIWKLNQKQGVVDNIYIFNKTLTSKIDFDADYETLNLLTKTLKALEVENNAK